MQHRAGDGDHGPCSRCRDRCPLLNQTDIAVPPQSAPALHGAGFVLASHAQG